MKQRLLLSVFVLASAVAVWGKDLHHYTNEFAAEIEGGDEVADLVAGTHGLRVIRKLVNLPNIYVLGHEGISRRSKRSADDVIQRLKRDPNVKIAEQQRLLKRVKRDILHDKQVEFDFRTYKDKSVFRRPLEKAENTAKRKLPVSDIEFAPRHYGKDMNFIDPFYKDQWYLVNHGQTGGPKGNDVNVLPAWQKGFSGKGQVVCVLDDGIQHTHEDLKDNYDPKASADFNDRKDNRNDPTPRMNGDNTHGTRCAGEIAAKANNTMCGVGIAFNARIGGVRVLDGPITDALEAEAATYNYDYITIYSASWGPPDNGKTMEGPGHFLHQALKQGIAKGRGGKGSIYVWATGNGGAYNDTCSCDGYVSSIFTLSIGVVNDLGLSAYFSERCPSTMAVIFNGGAHVQPGKQDYRNPSIKVVTTDVNNGCTLNFQGTSSAAPLAAGCFALVLEANPNLTWRDLQHIVVRTARVTSDRENGWLLNGAGFHINAKFGFGSLDCSHMVEVAQNWTTVPEQHICFAEEKKKDVPIPPGGTVTETFHTEACKNNPKHRIDHLEHVEVHIKLSTRYRGDTNMFLISPDGTRSEILRLRQLDDTDTGIDFTFMTVFNWGENPRRGDWKLEITDVPSSKYRNNDAVLHSWKLTLYGTAARDSDKDEREEETEAVNASHDELAGIMEKEEHRAEDLNISEEKKLSFPKGKEVNMKELWEKVDKMNDGEVRDFIRSLSKVMRALEEEDNQKQEEKRVYKEGENHQSLHSYRKRNFHTDLEQENNFLDEAIRSLAEYVDEE